MLRGSERYGLYFTAITILFSIGVIKQCQDNILHESENGFGIACYLKGNRI